MSPSNPVQIIQDLLEHEYIRERKKGLQQGADFLAQGLYRTQIRALLEKTARGDLVLGVAEMARQVLAEDDQRHATYPPQYERKGSEHIVGTICSKGHPSYYDKRRICPGEDRYRMRRADGMVVDQLVVKCQTCGEEMKIEVDCGGYK